RRGSDGEGNKGSQKQAFSSLHISPPISLYVRYRARSLARLAASLPPARGPRLRSWGRGLRPAEQHEVVAVDHLVAALVAEQALDVARVRALDLLELRRAVVDQAARELAPVGAEAAHAVPHAEAAHDPTHARREEAPAALGERALGARVEVEVTRGVERVGDPVLAVREAVTVGEEQRARLGGRIEDRGQDALAGAVGDERRDAGGGRVAGRRELGGHAARADAALCRSGGARHALVLGARHAHQRGVRVEARIARVQAL